MKNSQRQVASNPDLNQQVAGQLEGIGFGCRYLSMPAFDKLLCILVIAFDSSCETSKQFGRLHVFSEINHYAPYHYRRNFVDVSLGQLVGKYLKVPQFYFILTRKKCVLVLKYLSKVAQSFMTLKDKQPDSGEITDGLMSPRCLGSAGLARRYPYRGQYGEDRTYCLCPSGEVYTATSFSDPANIHALPLSIVGVEIPLQRIQSDNHGLGVGAFRYAGLSQILECLLVIKHELDAVGVFLFQQITDRLIGHAQDVRAVAMNDLDVRIAITRNDIATLTSHRGLQ
jgi:hypothetical protein